MHDGKWGNHLCPSKPRDVLPKSGLDISAAANKSRRRLSLCAFNEFLLWFVSPETRQSASRRSEKVCMADLMALQCEHCDVIEGKDTDLQPGTGPMFDFSDLTAFFPC